MFLLLLTSLVLSYAFYQYLIARRLPSGPIPILLLGNLPHLFWYCRKLGNFALAMREMQKRFGDVHTLWIGPMPFVNICTYEKAKDLMVVQGHTQLGRYMAPFATLAEIDDKGKIWGIVSSTGETWSEHRNFAINTLKQFGMGNNLMESRIMEEFNLRCDELEKDRAGDRFSTTAEEFTELLIGNLISNLLFGFRFDNPERRQDFLKRKHQMAANARHLSPIDFLVCPWWKYVPGLKSRWNAVMGMVNPALDFVQENTENRIQAIGSGKYQLEDEPVDFIDAYLLEQRKRGKDLGEMTTHGLVIDLYDLWQAGQSSTATTIQWGLYYFLQNPGKLKICQYEIRSLTNGNRDLLMADRTITPYFADACTEIQRCASIANFNLWRRTTGPSHIDGYDIPVGTLTTAQLSLILSDPNVFSESDKFNPARYTGDHGKELAEKTIPFGIGKRSCPGEGFARAQIYLILGNLLNRYQLTQTEDNPPTGAEGTFAIFNHPSNFGIELEKFV
ncbi:unnamed protein product, partial [Mesorhabditis spiculigera]